MLDLNKGLFFWGLRSVPPNVGLLQWDVDLDYTRRLLPLPHHPHLNILPLSEYKAVLHHGLPWLLLAWLGIEKGCICNWD
jgi:hypothetical protein